MGCSTLSLAQWRRSSLNPGGLVRPCGFQVEEIGSCSLRFKGMIYFVQHVVT